MNTIINITAPELPIIPFVAKNTGAPIAAATPKHISCLFVRLNITLVLTFDKSLGTETNAITENHLL
jgi:hypothetical protein